MLQWFYQVEGRLVKLKGNYNGVLARDIIDFLEDGGPLEALGITSQSDVEALHAELAR